MIVGFIYLIMKGTTTKGSPVFCACFVIATDISFNSSALNPASLSF